jgi:exopolyphosphatase/guanosine-5'-triphosphate,3'-diphosphate pyrophosphatase
MTWKLGEVGLSLHAVVSIGTNSTRLLIARETVDGTLDPIVHRSIGTRLGANLKEAGPLDPEAAARTLSVIDDFARELHSYGADVGAIATSAMRRASDGEKFAHEVERRVGARLEILSGPREAELSFVGATADRVHDAIVGVVDVGGGSTEYASGMGHVEGRVSCEIGAVRLSETLPALLGAEIPKDIPALEAEARGIVRERLAQLADFPHPASVFAVGGTMFNAAAISTDRDREDIDGIVLSRTMLTELARKFLAMDTALRRVQPRISPQRADIFPAGLLIADEVLDLLDVDECTVSQRDLLYGYLIENHRP